jgi:hypothetical protein
MTRAEVRGVLGPDGQPESYTWVVHLRDGSVLTELSPTPGLEALTFSQDVPAERVQWLIAVAQYQGLGVHAVLVPEGARAHFARSRSLGRDHLGQVISEPRYGTAIGYRWPDGTGPTLLIGGTSGATLLGDERTVPEHLHL